MVFCYCTVVLKVEVFNRTPLPSILVLYLTKMAFRKRNVGIPGPSNQPPGSATEKQLESSTSPLRREPRNSIAIPSLALGTRPSPLDGRLTTSTGTQSLDNLLAGHAGLALGCSILLEESGTTDYAGTLLRYYAAEGVVQGHNVHVVGVGEQWSRELPGLVAASIEESGKSAQATDDKERMKIAWRYERLGEFSVGGFGSRGGILSSAQFVYIATRTSGQIIGCCSCTDRCSTTIITTRADKSFTRRAAARTPCSVLSFLRLDKALDTFQSYSHQFHPDSSSSTHNLPIPAGSPSFVTANILLCTRYNSSPDYPNNALPCILPSPCQHTRAHSPVFTHSPQSTPTIFDPFHSNDFPSLNALSTQHRSRPLDGDPFRRCH